MVYENRVQKAKDEKWVQSTSKKISKMTALNLYQMEAKIENLGKPKAQQTKMQKVSKNWIELSDIDRKNYEDKLKQTDVIIEMMRKLEGKEKLGENAENEGQNMEKMEEKEEKMEKKEEEKPTVAHEAKKEEEEN